MKSGGQASGPSRSAVFAGLLEGPPTGLNCRPLPTKRKPRIGQEAKTSNKRLNARREQIMQLHPTVTAIRTVLVGHIAGFALPPLNVHRRRTRWWGRPRSVTTASSAARPGIGTKRIEANRRANIWHVACAKEKGAAIRAATEAEQKAARNAAGRPGRETRKEARPARRATVPRRTSPANPRALRRGVPGRRHAARDDPGVAWLPRVCIAACAAA